MKLRQIKVEIIEKILKNPDQIVAQSNKYIYHGLILENNKNYLIRIFVNAFVDPAVIITAYKTSKIDKYL